MITLPHPPLLVQIIFCEVSRAQPPSIQYADMPHIYEKNEAHIMKQLFIKNNINHNRQHHVDFSGINDMDNQCAFVDFRIERNDKN